MPICPAGLKFNLKCAGAIQRSILYLNPSKLTLPVRNQIERRVLGLRHANRESLFEQINLSLQNTQVTLSLRVMCRQLLPQILQKNRVTSGFHGIAISITC